MWHYGIWIHSLLTSIGVVHSTWPSRAMWHMHAQTFYKWHKMKKKKNRNKKVTLHLLIHGPMQGRGLTSLVAWINDKTHDVRDGNMIIRSEKWTMNIRSLGFGNIREWVILWGWYYGVLGCNPHYNNQFSKFCWLQTNYTHEGKVLNGSYGDVLQYESLKSYV